jgi:hypothetical protein
VSKVKGLSWMLMVILLGLVPGRATTFLQFNSSYLGDGWFQYQMQVMADPFFVVADITGLDLNFTNQINQSSSTSGWAYENANPANSDSDWAFSQNTPARPYTVTFLVQSSETSYRLATNGIFDGAVVLLSLQFAGIYPGTDGAVFSQNIVGYAGFPCLVPCEPDAADGSPTNSSYTLKLVPDVNIQQLIQTNGVVQGVDFLWNSDATFLLQASQDMAAWTNVAYIWSTPPETLWTNTTPLNHYGQFFRVELVADGYQTDLPPLNEAVGAVKPAVVRANAPSPSGSVHPCVCSCQITQGKVAVNVTTQPGLRYTVAAMDRFLVARAAQAVTGTGASATVYFDPATLPTPVYFQAAPAP